MSTQIHLVRHAEAIHNATRDKTIIDPPLTTRGHQESAQLAKIFPRHDHVALVLSSPLRRSLQTAIDGFSHILDNKHSYLPPSVAGIEDGAILKVYPELQPPNDKRSDMGSDRTVLEEEYPGLDFSSLNACWPRKEGEYADTNDANAKRARKIRGHLAELVASFEGKQRTDIVLVTHGIVGEIVAGITNHPPWPRASCLSYVLEKDGSGEYQLVLIQSR